MYYRQYYFIRPRPLYRVYSFFEDRALSRHWRFQSSLLGDDNFISNFTSEVKMFYSINSPSINNPSILWETCKAYCWGLIMSFVALKRRREVEQRKLFECRLAYLEKHHISNPSPKVLKDLLATRTALNILLVQDCEHSLKFPRQKLYEFGDKPGKYLANLVIKRADSQTIVSITDANGIRSFDTKTINKEFALFYANLYKSELPDNALTLMHLFFYRPKTP